MKTPKRPSARDKLIGKLQLVRLQFARAESQLESAKEVARLAKRRRKEAKEAARRAKKRARLARKEFAEAKLALAEAEKKLNQTRQFRLKRRTPKRPVAKAAPARRKKSPPPAKSAVPKTVKLERRAPARPKRPTQVRRKPAASVATITVPRDSEQPGATAFPSGGAASIETGAGGAGSRAPESKSEAPEASVLSADSDTPQ